jgi:DNA-binding XRE family transcriptional regulator
MNDAASERILFSLDTDNRITNELDEIIIKNGFAAALIERRTSLEMTQKEMADYLEVSQPTVCRLESAVYPLSIKFLCELCEKLDMKMQFSLSLVD